VPVEQKNVVFNSFVCKLGFFWHGWASMTCCIISYNITMATVSIYSERQKYGINFLKIKQIFFQKNLWTGQF
jgi:hypothetical protein